MPPDWTGGGRSVTMHEVSLAKELLRSWIVPGAERLVGRANVVRFARFLTNTARLDAPNDMRTNGEQLLMRAVCAHAEPTMTVLDIGANVGDWTLAFAAAARAARCKDVVIHSFEPCEATHAMLERRLNHGRIDPAEVVSHACGMSDQPRRATLHVVGDGVGVNSVHIADGYQWTRTETVKLDTIDDFAERHDLRRITLAKSDTEGHDLHVMRGARRLLSQRAISVIQFEYNWRWVMARTYLRDVFEVAGTAYRVGKITPRGVEWYDAWDQELETFREANYVLCLKDCVSWFPAVRWWKLDT